MCTDGRNAPMNGAAPPISTRRSDNSARHAWERIRAGLSEAEIDHARRVAEAILGQLDVSHANAVDAAAEKRLFEQFERFLKEVRAIEVPLTGDLNELFYDYFERNPPFSEKKKTEFPDAIVIGSLKNFASKIEKKVYVVSGDNDLRACCVEESNLIHAQSINGIISRATVTQKLHGDLLNFAANSGFKERD